MVLALATRFDATRLVMHKHDTKRGAERRGNSSILYRDRVQNVARRATECNQIRKSIKTLGRSISPTFILCVESTFLTVNLFFASSFLLS